MITNLNIAFRFKFRTRWSNKHNGCVRPMPGFFLSLRPATVIFLFDYPLTSMTNCEPSILMTSASNGSSSPNRWKWSLHERPFLYIYISNPLGLTFLRHCHHHHISYHHLSCLTIIYNF